MRHAFAIAAYGESPYLVECIESILAQSVRSGVVICTSTPSPFLESIASTHGVPLAINEKRQGIANDWNFALTTPRADHVTIAHQDDLYQPDYAERIIAGFEACPDASIAFTGASEHGPAALRKFSMNVLVKRALLWRAFGKRDLLSDSRDKRRMLDLGNPICCPSVTFNRKLIAEFRFCGNFQINLDWDAWLRLADTEGAFLYLRKTLVSHRIHPASETTASIADNRRAAEDRLMFERLRGAFVARLIHPLYRFSYLSNRT